MAQTEAQILEEINRLSGAINRHRSQQTAPPYRGGYHGRASFRKPYSKPVHANPQQEVVLNGQVFQSRGGKSLSLVRKGAPTVSRPTIPPAAPTPSTSASAPNPNPRAQAVEYVHAGKNKLIAANRINKKPPPPPPAVLAAKRARLAKLSGVITNVQAHRNKSLGKRKLPVKRKVVDKPCRFWTRTGICQKGNTCPYQHDPNKTAICPRFVTGDCPHTALTCSLSHDPTPERMPLCVHFQNAGRCRLGSACPYPHVFLGVATTEKRGVCRDFAVLGYCEKGIECDKTHVRECPDFAERGVCGTKGCKLPHVIRANRGKMEAAAQKMDAARTGLEAVVGEQREAQLQQLGDEFVSLMFEESEDEDGGADDDDHEEDEEGESASDEAEDEEAMDEQDESEQREDEHDVDTLLSEPDDYEM